MSAFYQNLRKYRKQRGMTQNELGAILGCGYTDIAQYESGRAKPMPDDLKKIAEVLGVRVDELLGEMGKL